MTLQELTVKVGGSGTPNPKVHLMCNGDGSWSAYYQIIEVILNRDDPMAGYTHVEQPWFTDKQPSEAIKALVMWLRGKTIRERPVGWSAVGGEWVDVPKDLEVPTL